MTRGTVEYSSNNSGGNWWVEDKDWYALEAAGWEVAWRKDENNNKLFRADKEGRWLGALATSAKKSGVTLREAIEDWEEVTGLAANELGCSCCGTPHYFIFEGEDGSYDSYSPSYPAYGDRPW